MSKVYLGGTIFPVSSFRIGNTPLTKLCIGSTPGWVADGVVPVPSTVVGCTIGDSTIAAYLGQDSVPSLVSGFVSTTLATPGETIAQQLGRWNALTLAQYASFQVVYVQIGLNDVQVSHGDAASAISQLQNLVNVIRSNIQPWCKIYIAKMLPCKQRWIDLDGATVGAQDQAKWVAMNDAIAGLGSTPITSVDARIVSHVPLLDDGNGNLNPLYNMGDNIHPNNAGRQIDANAWRSQAVADGLLN